MTPARVFTATFLLGFSWVFAMCCAADPAFAQTVVDMRPTATAALDWIAATAGTVLTVLAGFLVRFVSSKTGLANSELEASLVARLDTIIHKGIDYAYTIALNEVNKPGSGLGAVKFDNWFLSIAASYVNTSAPDIINKLALSQARIEAMITARLPAYTAQIPVEGALSTPTVPAVPAQPVA